MLKREEPLSCYMTAFPVPQPEAWGLTEGKCPGSPLGQVLIELLPALHHVQIGTQVKQRMGQDWPL